LKTWSEITVVERISSSKEAIQIFILKYPFHSELQTWNSVTLINLMLIGNNH
jgi:hypothetical protein